MKKVRYIAIILFTILQTILATNLYAQHFQLNSRLDTTVTPARLHIRIEKPDHNLSKMRVMSLNDADNTQILSFYFKGCARSQITTYLDTVISINTPYPFSLSAYTIWDTSSNCPYPTTPMVIDSLIIANGLTTTINNAHKENDLVRIFPNPAKDVLYLKADNSINILSVKLVDAAGALVKEVSGSSTEINTSNLSKGNYLIEVYTNKGRLLKNISVH